MAGKKRRTSIPADEKKGLIDRIAVMKLEGHTTQSVADELGLCWNTVDKYWSGIIASTGDVDLSQLLRERRLITERILNKSLRAYYAGEIQIRDVTLAMEQADKYSGLTGYLDKLVVTSQLPPLLEIIVQQVKLDEPPEND